MMLGPFSRERLENWVADFCASDAVRGFPGGVREFAGPALTHFLLAACQGRGIEPDDLQEQDLKSALLGAVARMDVPPSVKADMPGLCGAFLGWLQEQGRLGGGRALGAYVRALKPAFEEAVSGKAKPIVRPGSRLGRNDPCPCGSGKKYKKCCMNE